MKKFLAILFCMTLICMPLTACGGGKADPEPEEEIEEIEENNEAEQIAEIDEDKLEEAGDTLESRLPLLKNDGWTQEDGAYVYATEDEERNGKYIITANGNEADVVVSIDYFGDNAEMVDFYKDDPDAGKAICAYWFLRAVGVLEVTDCTENYKMIIGDTEVLSGSMTYAEAEEMYDGYFEE